MKIFLFSFTLIWGLAALPPLPPLPPLPSIPGGGATSAGLPPLPVPAAPVSSSALPPLPSPSVSAASSVASAPADAPARPDPIMVEKSKDIRVLVPGSDDAERNKSIDGVLKSISDIEQKNSDLQTTNQEVDGLFVASEKKMDVFFMEADGFIGKTNAYLEDLAMDLSKKIPDLKVYDSPGLLADLKKKLDDAVGLAGQASTSVDVLKKQLSDAQASRDALSKEEDDARQKVNDFKKKGDEVASLYAQAISVKNDVLLKNGDGAAALKKCADLAKNAQDLVDGLKNKDVAGIKDSLKKMDGMLSFAQDAKKALEGKIADLKKNIAIIASTEKDLSLAQQEESLKDIKLALPKQAVKDEVKGGSEGVKNLETNNGEAPESGGDDVAAARDDMFHAVLGTLQRGASLMIARLQVLAAPLAGRLFAHLGGVFSRLSERVASSGSDTQSSLSDVDSTKDKGGLNDTSDVKKEVVADVKKDAALVNGNVAHVDKKSDVTSASISVPDNVLSSKDSVVGAKPAKVSNSPASLPLLPTLPPLPVLPNSTGQSLTDGASPSATSLASAKSEDVVAPKSVALPPLPPLPTLAK